MLLLMWVQNVAYNGLDSLGFADIFYGSKELNTKRDRKYWFAFILVSFLMLLVTNSDVFFPFLPDSVLRCLYSFLPCLYPNPSLFHEEFPLCLEYGALYYFAFILYYERPCREPRG